jgi:hypothetical protein
VNTTLSSAFQDGTATPSVTGGAAVITAAPTGSQTEQTYSSPTHQEVDPNA